MEERRGSRFPHCATGRFRAIAFWPGDSQVVAAGTELGVLLSRDGGITWSLVSPSDNTQLQRIVSVAFDPKNSNTIYAGTPHFASGIAAAQVLAKPQVANLIVKVENGVDQFRDYLNKRGENGSSVASAGQAQTHRARRGNAQESTKAVAQAGKDELDDALSNLNRSTNRLRRKFDTTDTWMQTKAEVERVMGDGRRINQVVARGKYGAEAARLWSVLRTGMNDLARAYGLQPLGI